MASAESGVRRARFGSITRPRFPLWHDLCVWLLRATLPMLTFALALPAHSRESQSRVLFLYPDTEIPIVTSVTDGARQKFAERTDLKIQLYREFLDLSRFPNPSHKARTISYLASKYAFAKPNAVLALGPDTLRLAIDHRPTLAPRQESIWREHHNLALAVMAVIAFLSAALATLTLQIRKRKRAELRLRQSDKRLNFAAASAGIGLWQYDPRTNELWSSEHCRKMFGLTASRPLTTEVMLDAVHPNDRHVAIASVRAATFGNLDHGVSEFRVADANGRDRWIEVRGHTDIDRDGSVRVSGIFRDISAYKEAQLEAAMLSKRLLSLQDDERERIAQEIHDSTAQHLAAIGLNLVALQGRRGIALGYEGRIIEDMRGSLREAVREVRTISYLLHPQALTKSGLNGTLRRYVDGFERRTGIELTLRTTPIADRCPLPQQLAVLRVVQEALANVHRHASASRASVKFRVVSNRLHLVVSDDGRGVGDNQDRRRLDTDALPLGVGVPGMTARVRHFGGTVDIRSGPLGTSVHVAMPITAGVRSALDGPSPSDVSAGLDGESDSGSITRDRVTESELRGGVLYRRPS